MLHLTALIAEPSPTATSAPRLSLTYRERVKSRLAAMLPNGRAVAIVLPRGTVMRDGSVLGSDDGTIVVVEAVAEPLAKVTASSDLALMRAVYHLANRHVPAQLASDHFLIERDPVLERMLVGLGARVEHVDAAFDPESGAYDSHGHGHAGEIDIVSATVGEQLSIAAHRERGVRR
jgi:urease accessory protein